MTHTAATSTWHTHQVRQALGPGFQFSNRADRIVRVIHEGHATNTHR